MSRVAALVVALFAALTFARAAHAHGFSPSVLELRERESGVWDTELRRGGSEPAPEPELPASCTFLGAGVDGPVRCPHLRGAAVGARGLDGKTELLVRVHFLDGTTATGSLHAEGDRFVVPEAKPALSGLGAFVALGARHILGGPDHLLFLTVLFFLLSRKLRPLAGALTAFTAAHSLTLGLAAFAIVRIPSSLAEPLIALSIVCLAAELARNKRRSRPWLLAFVFGLLHGTGFASGLEDAGVSRAELPRALFGFNVGVELGQLAFVFALALAAALLARLPIARILTKPRLVAYATGAVAAAWTLQRAAEIVQ